MIKEKMLNACADAVKNNKRIVKTFWSSGWPGHSYSVADNKAINCPIEINPLLAVLYLIDPNTPKYAYSSHVFKERERGAWNNHYYEQKRHNKYWNIYDNDEWKPVEAYLGCDKAWICGFMNGWLYKTRRKSIKKDDLAIIPKKERKSYEKGFSFAKEFRPLINTIAVKRFKIEKSTREYVKKSLAQGLKPIEIKTIVDEALAEAVITE